jgi:hypothetical protein
MLQWLVRRVGAQRLCGWLALLGLSLISLDAMALSCPDNREASGGLCYLKPREGYSCQATLCVERCRSGYVSSGIGTCHYNGTLTYTQRPYLTRSHSGMQRCLALFYNNCRDGYHMDVCGICSYKGAWDITRASYDRGPGINPDVSSAFNRLSDVTRATWGRLLAGIQIGSARLLAVLQGLVQDQLYAAVKDVGSVARNNPATSCLLKDVSTRLAGLKRDADSLNVLKRLIVSGSTAKADPQVALDMLYVAGKLGLMGSVCGYPIGPEKMSFGVYGQYEAVAGAGVSGTVGIAMNLPTSSTNISKLDPRVFISQGLMFGPEVAEAASIAIFIALDDVRGLNGVSVSVGLDADVGGGGNMGVGFNVPDSLPRFDLTKPLDSYKDWLRTLAPSFSVGVSTGAGGGGAVTFGYGATMQLK